MYIYIKVQERDCWLYTVGYYSPDGCFNSIEDFGDEMMARKLVNYLNGGNGYNEGQTLQVSAHVETGY